MSSRYALACSGFSSHSEFVCLGCSQVLRRVRDLFVESGLLSAEDLTVHMEPPMDLNYQGWGRTAGEEEPQ